MITEKIWIVLFLLVGNLFTSALYGQKHYVKADVRAMFPSGTKDVWINTLSGTLDNTYVVDMIIGTDGQTCKGLYTLRSSNTTFFFEGEDVDHKLKLVELTGDNRMSGFIYGNYDGRKLNGTWMNGDKTISLPFQLTFVNSFENYSFQKCNNNYWYRMYAGKVNYTPVRILIARENDIYKLTNYEGGKKMVDIIPGSDKRVDIIKPNFNNSVLSGKWLIIDTTSHLKTDVIYPAGDGYEIKTVLKLESHLDFDCFEYADYYSMLHCIRPVTGKPTFDIWIERKFKSWINDGLKTLRSTKKDDIGTKDRWIQAAEGWVEIDMFGPSMISGTIYMQTSWHKDTEKIAFIFDLKAGKEIVFYDIFENKFDGKAFFDPKIKEMKSKLTCKAEAKKWLDKQLFDYITLKDEGVCFRTDFNTLYGEQEIVIPYTMFEQNIKNKNLLKGISAK